MKMYKDGGGVGAINCNGVLAKVHLPLSTQIIREPFDYICQVKGKEVRVKLIEVRVQ